MIARARLDLPHPDSPTSPRVSFRSIPKLTPDTARTVWLRLILKETWISLISRTGPVSGGWISVTLGPARRPRGRNMRTCDRCCGLSAVVRLDGKVDGHTDTDRQNRLLWADSSGPAAA